MIEFYIELTDHDGHMRIHVHGDNRGKTTEYEVDFAEELMTAIYYDAHCIAKKYGDSGFTDLNPLQIEKRKPKPKGRQQ